jgi:RimJ/RimL family protein N-acetyltransferase
MIETDRLILRPFEMSDLDDYAALNADPKVMRFYPMLYSRERSLESLESCRASWDTHGYGFSAVTDKDGVFLGLCGLSMFTAEAPFTPKVEIGWRFVPSAWGKGFASEAARGWLEFAFKERGLEDIVSFTAVPNEPSAKVMQRIGMTRYEAWDFDMPFLPKDHWLAAHIVYRLTNEAYSMGESR